MLQASYANRPNALSDNASFTTPSHLSVERTPFFVIPSPPEAGEGSRVNC